MPVQITNHDTGTATVIAPAHLWNAVLSSDHADMEAHRDGTLSVTLPIGRADDVYRTLDRAV
ncbi:MAG: hypothetical protein VR70_14435 [Rhodospirillaceae bacterium BRH_c57]|nr:MAG: hypothetical protein VR70_14435 [Rhodospirillaceae bacterium BRH_c57]